ncbi:hypothetical protein WANA31_0625 [Wolbachia endosymbiont of Drosophila ananassae]|nr:hypothetical protein WANA31_0625 [Wolbachia endosymbiont of Drosophila ananassae]RLT61788.1 hypothetical protein WANA34_0130 [Wolbachia endosymbiont of Drosophila ananassae]RLT62910.1 hypothetical protein WANA13_0219 [Wolbachia endosymbiont of Drosophila ananassae]
MNYIIYCVSDNLVKKFLKENFLLIFSSQIYLDGVTYNAKETKK